MSSIIKKDLIKNATDVEVLEVKLINHAGVVYDCKNLWTHIEIYESIFSNSVTGSLTIQDRNNILRNMPAIGRERLEIIYKTPSTDRIVKKFRVYDITLSEKIPGRNSMILTFQFSSIQSYINNQVKISRSLTNKTFVEMAELIYKEYLLNSENNLEFRTVANTQGKTNVVIPTWSPFQTLNWLASKCEYYGNCDYVFFEGLNGFYFVPISSFKKTDPIKTYKYTTEEVKDISKDVDLEMKKIISYEIIQNGNNKMELESEGVFSSGCLTHDLTNKTIKRQNFVYSLDFGKENIGKLSKNPIAPSRYTLNISPASKFFFNTKSSFMFNGNKEQYDPTIIQRRTSQMLRNNAKVLKIDVTGDSRRRCGEVIKLQIPSAEFLEIKPKEDVLDGMLSGKYIIASIGHHIIRHDGYHMSMEVMRDSYEESISDIVTI